MSFHKDYDEKWDIGHVSSEENYHFTLHRASLRDEIRRDKSSRLVTDQPVTEGKEVPRWQGGRRLSFPQVRPRYILCLKIIIEIWKWRGCMQNTRPRLIFQNDILGMCINTNGNAYTFVNCIYPWNGDQVEKTFAECFLGSGVVMAGDDQYKTMHMLK